MIDDTERRLRESVRGANLPNAPEALHGAMPEIVSSPAPAPVSARRPWLRALPAIAAVVGVALVVLVATGGFGRLGSAVVPGSPSANAAAVPSEAPSETPFPAPTVPPSSAAPPTSVDVIDAGRLQKEIQAVQNGTEVAHDVVVNVGADPTKLPSPITRECADPLGTCTVVGVLDGFNSTIGVITTRAQAQTLPPPVTPSDLTAPLALRLVPGGPIELLGHVDLAAGSGQLDTAALKVLTATAAPGHVVAVLAWLQSALSPSCGPMMPDDVPNPFICPGEASFLTDTPVNPVTIVENPSPQLGSSIAPTLSGSWNIPDSAVMVGAFSYDQVAPSPWVEGMAGTSRQGLYLVRMVSVDNADCQKCRGWLAVGRLDASSTAGAGNAPAFNAGVKVYAAAELEAVLQADRASWVGKAVLVDGSISGASPRNCATLPPDQPPTATVCDWGRLDGTSETVRSTRYTSLLVDPDNLYLSPNSAMAMRVLDNGLEYLGWMGSAGGPDFQASVSDMAGEITEPGERAAHVHRVGVARMVGGAPVPSPDRHAAARRHAVRAVSLSLADGRRDARGHDERTSRRRGGPVAGV